MGNNLLRHHAMMGTTGGSTRGTPIYLTCYDNSDNYKHEVEFTLSEALSYTFSFNYLYGSNLSLRGQYIDILQGETTVINIDEDVAGETEPLNYMGVEMLNDYNLNKLIYFDRIAVYWFDDEAFGWIDSSIAHQIFNTFKSYLIINGVNQHTPEYTTYMQFWDTNSDSNYYNTGIIPGETRRIFLYDRYDDGNIGNNHEILFQGYGDENVYALTEDGAFYWWGTL